MRLSVAAVVCLSILGVVLAAPASASIKKFTNIPAQDLGSALQTLAQQHDVQVVYLSDGIDKLRTPGAVGDLTSEEAMKRLLKGTGLSYRYLDEKTITISPVGGAASLPGRDAKDTKVAAYSNASGGTNASGGSDNSGDSQAAKDDTLWNRFRVAQMNAQASSSVGSDVQNSRGNSEQSPELAEILVSAQKKTEREQDVPIAMTVLNPANLALNGQPRMQDYFASVPGLSINANTASGGLSYVTIRGLSAGFQQNPTIATVIDDVPVGSSQWLSFGSLTQPDLDPSDLARIEVLKGPQGTLYGADSLGGLIKYVTTDPSTSAFSGRAEVAGSDIPDGGAGYAARAAANIPLSDSVALRASGFYRHDPGYIHDLTTGEDNVNWADVYGGRLSLLYRPSDNLSLKLGALIQDTDANGTNVVNSNIQGQFVQGDLNHTDLPGASAYHTQWQLYSATLNAKVADLDIVSVTGYNTNFIHSYYDLSNSHFLDNIANTYFPGAAGWLGVDHWITDKFSQELRLSSSVQHWLDWTVGGFYTHEESPVDSEQQGLAANIATGNPAGLLVNFNYPVTFTEYAVFGDLTFHVTRQFDLQLGARQSRDTINYAPFKTGPAVFDLYLAPSPDVPPPDSAKGTPFTFLVTPKYAISPDLQVYGRIASGYRIGGPNLFAGSGVDQYVPRYYDPDKTINYEVGTKGDVLDHRLSFNAAVYYIDWKNFQLSITTPSPYGSVTYNTNAGNAKSEGVELEVQGHPLTGLTLGVQGSYNNAVLTQDLPAEAVTAGAYGLAGDRLPYSIKFSGGLTVNQDFSLTGQWTGFVGGAFTYVGSRPGEFASGPPPYTPSTQRIDIPSYTVFDVRTGARYQSWLVSLYVNNVADKRGIVGIFSFVNNLGNTAGANATVIQPRTAGLSVSRRF